MTNDEIRPYLEQYFTHHLEITLTLNRGIASTAREAHAFACRERLVAGFVKALYRRHKLSSRRFVSALEFHRDEWPHWHVVVDALPRSATDMRPYIYIPVVKSLWGWGHIDVVARTLDDQVAYLVKMTRQKFAQWAEELPRQIRLLSRDRVGYA